MELLASIAAISGGILVILIAGAVILALSRQDIGSRPLLLEEALRRQSDEAAQRALASGSHEFAVAVQRCLACGEAAHCRAWLASGAQEGYRAFCPNAGYIERMKKLAV